MAGGRGRAGKPRCACVCVPAHMHACLAKVRRGGRRGCCTGRRGHKNEGPIWVCGWSGFSFTHSCAQPLTYKHAFTYTHTHIYTHIHVPIVLPDKAVWEDIKRPTEIWLALFWSHTPSHAYTLYSIHIQNVYAYTLYVYTCTLYSIHIQIASPENTVWEGIEDGRRWKGGSHF